MFRVMEGSKIDIDKTKEALSKLDVNKLILVPSIHNHCGLLSALIAEFYIDTEPENTAQKIERIISKFFSNLDNISVEEKKVVEDFRTKLDETSRTLDAYIGLDKLLASVYEPDSILNKFFNLWKRKKIETITNIKDREEAEITNELMAKEFGYKLDSTRRVLLKDGEPVIVLLNGHYEPIGNHDFRELRKLFLEEREKKAVQEKGDTETLTDAEKDISTIEFDSKTIIRKLIDKHSIDSKLAGIVHEIAKQYGGFSRLLAPLYLQGTYSTQQTQKAQEIQESINKKIEVDFYDGDAIKSMMRYSVDFQKEMKKYKHRIFKTNSLGSIGLRTKRLQVTFEGDSIESCKVDLTSGQKNTSINNLNTMLQREPERGDGYMS